MFIVPVYVLLCYTNPKVSALVDGRRKRGRPTRFKDVCNLKSLNISTDKWQELANDRDKWRSLVYRSLKEREK